MTGTADWYSRTVLSFTVMMRAADDDMATFKPSFKQPQEPTSNEVMTVSSLKTVYITAYF